MIPMELTLRNFLTYDDNDGAGYRFNFRDHRLWSISGDNGAGKSTLFDVITYTLFGQHRGGAQRDEELLNKQASNFVCSFTFSHNHLLYKVTRTLAKKIKRNGEAKYESACQVELYDDQNTAWRQVPDTDSVRALEEYIRRLLGFDYDTFISSVLLLQGESDKLIRALPRERFQHLSGILDLSHYRALEDAATQRARDAREQRDWLSRRVQAEGIPSEEDVQLAANTADAAQREYDRALHAAEAARAFTQRVENFWALTARRSEIGDKVTAMTAALENAEAIRSDAKLLAQLTDVLPRLRDAHICLTNAAEADARAAAVEAEATTVNVDKAAASLAQAQQAHTDAENACKRLTQQRRQLNREREDLKLERLLAERLDAADGAIDHARAAISKLDQELEELPSVVLRAERLDSLVRGLGQMQTYKAKREELAEILDGRNAAEVESTDLEVRAARNDAEVAVEALRASLAQAQLTAGELSGQLEVARRTLLVRQQAGSEGVCSHCGQKVTAQHIEKEIDDCQALIAKLETLAADAGRSVTSATTDVAAAELALKAIREAEHRAGQRARDVRRLGADLRELDADEALVSLPRDCNEALHGPLDRLDDAINGFAREVKERPKAVKCHQQLLTAQSERERLACEQVAEEKKRDAILGQITRERIAVVVTRAGELDELSAALDSTEQLLEDERDQTAARVMTAQAELDGVAQRKAELAAEAQRERASAQAQRDIAVGFTKHIGDNYLPVTAEKIAELEVRHHSLAGAEDRLLGLEEAEREVEGARGELREAEAGLDVVPITDRVPLEEALVAQTTAEESIQTAAKAHADARDAASAMRAKRDELLGMQREAEALGKAYQVWGRLQRLLGRSGIQLAVMKRDLAAIEKLANSLLARISGGNLRLHIECMPGRGGAEEIKFRCEDLSSADAPLDVAFLSGGQKFRVAVALAAGIGQYAGLGGSLPSQIIDEGFGSLDESGRVEMLDAVREMAPHFERIIVVSHTDSFHDPSLFPARYELRKDGRKVTVTASV